MAQPSDCHGGVASFEAWEGTGTARFAIPSFEAGFLAVELTYGCMGSLFRHKELQGDLDQEAEKLKGFCLWSGSDSSI